MPLPSLAFAYLHRIGIGDGVLPEGFGGIDGFGHAGHAVVLVVKLLRAIEARHIIHERDEFRIVLAVVDDRENAVMCDGAFLFDKVGAGDALDCLSREIDIEPKVVGDVHHQGSGPDPAQIVIDVVGFADPVAPDQIDGVIELGPVDHVQGGLLVRRVPVEDLRLNGRKSL